MKETNPSFVMPGMMIEKIVERYFQEEMFKQPVRIVESSPAPEDGYIFKLSFSENEDTRVTRPKIIKKEA